MPYKAAEQSKNTPWTTWFFPLKVPTLPQSGHAEFLKDPAKPPSD